MDSIINEHISTLLLFTSNILSKLQAVYPALSRFWSCHFVQSIFQALQRNHVSNSGKVMINDRALSNIVAQTSLSYFMENKWRKITLIFFPHVLKKSVSFKKKWHKENKLVSIIYIFTCKCMQKAFLMTCVQSCICSYYFCRILYQFNPPNQNPLPID